jgi:hypothetical protein
MLAPSTPAFQGVPVLRAIVDERSSAWPFTAAAIAMSPAATGVYLLYSAGRLIYIGVALDGTGIRGELRKHLCGSYGGCTRTASAFVYELAPDPVARYRECLRAYREHHGGREPACNA